MTDSREIGPPQTPPVLLMVFRRPDLTRQMLESIRQARPVRLYVACDGPRPSHPDDVEKVGAVRDVIREFSEELHPITLFQETNLGCGKGVSRAISWFFEQEEEGIILEDDCLPDPTFYLFCATMLDRYRNVRNVMQICGFHLLGGKYPMTTDYLLSLYGFNWGWASWRRAWRFFDLDMDSWPRFKEMGLHKQFPFNPQIVTVFDETYDGRIDTWDYQWQFALLARGGLSVVPRTCLINNLGFRSDATHTRVAQKDRMIDVQPLLFPLRDYEFVFSDLRYDTQLMQLIAPQNQGSIASHVKRLLKTLTRHTLHKQVPRIGDFY